MSGSMVRCEGEELVRRAVHREIHASLKKNMVSSAGCLLSGPKLCWLYWFVTR